jgi:hypothetical protein
MRIKLPIGIKIVVVLSIVAILTILFIVPLAHPANSADTKVAAQIDQLLADTFKPSEPGAAVIVFKGVGLGLQSAASGVQA